MDIFKLENIYINHFEKGVIPFSPQIDFLWNLHIIQKLINSKTYKNKLPYVKMSFESQFEHPFGKKSHLQHIISYNTKSRQFF